MNRSLLLVILLTLCFSSYAQTRFKIKGKFIGAENASKVTLMGEFTQEIQLSDDKTFEFTGMISEPGIIGIKTDDAVGVSLWISKGTIDVTFLEYYPAFRDSTGKKYIKLVNMIGPPETETNELFTKRWNELAQTIKGIRGKEKLDTIAKAIYPEIADYITKNPTSHLSVYLIRRFPLSANQKLSLTTLLDKNEYYAEIEWIKKEIKEGETSNPARKINLRELRQ